MSASRFNGGSPSINAPGGKTAPVGVCDTVQALADLLRPATPLADAALALLLSILWQMPMYRDLRALDLWEHAYSEAWARMDKQVPRGVALDLIDAAFEFGRYNLYGAFDADGTTREFSVLRKQFNAAGVDCPLTPQLTDW